MFRSLRSGITFNKSSVVSIFTNYNRTGSLHFSPKTASNLLFNRSLVRIKSSTLFPNGVGSICRELIVPSGASQVDTPAPIQSIHGTMWISPQKITKTILF